MKTNEPKENQKILEAQYKELFAKAEKESPDTIKEIQTFTSHQVELASYQEYLNLLNQTPNTTTANSTT